MAIVRHIVIGPSSGGGGGGGGTDGYLGSFTNYSALTAAFPSGTLGDLATVLNAQGTAWLPWTFGGTYYPEGTYVWDGSKWKTNNQFVGATFQQLINFGELVARRNAQVFKAISANDNVFAGESVNVTTGASNITVRLPTITNAPLDYVEVIKVDAGAGNVIIDGLGSNIDGASTIQLSNQYDTAMLRWNGAEWITL